MKLILFLLFGERAQGERMPIPTLPPERPYDADDYNKWCEEVGFGSRYGTRGSFYSKK